MKKSIVLALSAIAVFAFQSCRKTIGDGPTITKTYSVSGFTAVNNEIDAEVYFTQDRVYSMEISGQSNIIDNIELPIAGGELSLQFKKFKHIGRHGNIVVRISGPSITGFGISGSGSIHANGPLSSAGLDLKVSGSGNISVASYDGDRITANISGSGRININAGQVVNENLKISGSGDIDMLNVAAKNVTTKTSGSGNTWVYATTTLDVTISGSGDVYYQGTPEVNASISGSGKLKHQ